MIFSEHLGEQFFKLNGEKAITRLGFGTLRITGANGWGEPNNRSNVLNLLRRLPELGVDLIDCADCYGPDVAEQLVGAALHPYPARMLITTKAGVTRPAPDQYVPLGRPEYLFQQVHKSLRNLKLEQIDLWQLHRIDPRVPQDEQFDAIKHLLNEGLIRHAGLSEITLPTLKAAEKFFPVATVQNKYSLADRAHEDVLEYCTQKRIGFMPWGPLGEGKLVGNSKLATLARKYNATGPQLAIAWLLKRSPVMLPIPGTSSLSHLAQNVEAANIPLSDSDFAKLDALGRSGSF